tara:strand:+ start:137 stop:361 length:225 start_codon:yes stop_codon:yes gene_type:complete
MKKLSILFIVLAIASISFSSCKKEEKNYCAACVEATTGYKPVDFCGEESAVDAYISELKKQGSAAGQSWSCTKK